MSVASGHLQVGQVSFVRDALCPPLLPHFLFVGAKCVQITESMGMACCVSSGLSQAQAPAQGPPGSLMCVS